MSSTPYLKLEPSIERQIAKNREQHVMSPFAFKDEDITRREENPPRLRHHWKAGVSARC